MSKKTRRGSAKRTLTKRSRRLMRRMRRIKTRRGGVRQARVDTRQTGDATRQTGDDTRQRQSVSGSIMKPVVDDIIKRNMHKFKFSPMQKLILERIKQNPRMAPEYLQDEKRKEIIASNQYDESIAVSRSAGVPDQFAPFDYENSDFLSVLQEIDNIVDPPIIRPETAGDIFDSSQRSF